MKAVMVTRNCGLQNLQDYKIRSSISSQITTRSKAISRNDSINSIGIFVFLQNAMAKNIRDVHRCSKEERIGRDNGVHRKEGRKSVRVYV